MALSDLSADIDALYRLPLADFTPARNALEKRVRAEQGKEAAADIKALEKPSISAWAVNQLYWKHRRDYDRLLRAGDELRAVQQKRLAGRDADVAAALEARREALSSLMETATEILRENGSTSPDIRQRVETTLEALSVYGTSDSAPRAGRLVGDVQPLGFAALAALVPAGPPGRAGAAKAPSSESATGSKPRAVPPPAPAAPKPESKRLEKARQALEQAEQQVTRAKEVAEQTSEAQSAAQAKWTAAREALDALQEQLNEAMDHERAAMTQRDEQRRAATQAAHALDRAERARDEAERYVQSLTRE
jgi:hypothetical protein